MGSCFYCWKKYIDLLGYGVVGLVRSLMHASHSIICCYGDLS